MTLVQPASTCLLAQPDLRPKASYLHHGDQARAGGSRVYRIRTSIQAHVWSIEVMLAFWQSLVFIALAEMGDKTQLVALAFATRFSARVVLAGVFAATLAVHLFSVAIGELLGLALPTFWISIAAGLAFIGFGIWTIRGDNVDDEETQKHSRFGPFMTVAITFFLAELGDKT